MCLGIPMQVKKINGYIASCKAKGEERDVSLFMLMEELISINDYVVVHLGNAIQKISEDEAKAAWDLYDLMLSEERGTNQP